MKQPLHRALPQRDLPSFPRRRHPRLRPARRGRALPRPRGLTRRFRGRRWVMRLDQALVAAGLADSRARAQALIAAGVVRLDGAPAGGRGEGAQGARLTLDRRSAALRLARRR